MKKTYLKRMFTPLLAGIATIQVTMGSAKAQEADEVFSSVSDPTLELIEAGVGIAGPVILLGALGFICFRYYTGQPIGRLAVGVAAGAAILWLGPDLVAFIFDNADFTLR